MDAEIVNAEIAEGLSFEQWETLKAIRRTDVKGRPIDPRIIDSLIRLGLAAAGDCRPSLTRCGRSVLLRGSPRLLDLAA